MTKDEELEGGTELVDDVEDEVEVIDEEMDEEVEELEEGVILLDVSEDDEVEGIEEETISEEEVETISDVLIELRILEKLELSMDEIEVEEICEEG